MTMPQVVREMPAWQLNTIGVEAEVLFRRPTICANAGVVTFRQYYKVYVVAIFIVFRLAAAYIQKTTMTVTSRKYFACQCALRGQHPIHIFLCTFITLALTLAILQLSFYNNMIG
jgi:hypothetical protein